MKRGRYTVRKGAHDQTVMVAAEPIDPRDSRGLAARRYAKLLEAHLRNEAKLARVVRAWDKSRAAVRRAEKRLDRDVIGKAHADAPGFDDELP